MTMNRAAEEVVGLDDPDGAEYGAFISYSHRQSTQVALDAKRLIESLGKRWHVRRACQVFLDRSNLAAAPELWNELVQELAKSRWFVLLASPDAAASKWVDKEIRWWLENRSADTILIAVTAGNISWDGDSGDWSADLDRTTALPGALRGAFAAEPHWVDLRAPADEPLSALELEDKIATIAAKVRGIAKDQLYAEDRRQHRRQVRTWQLAALVLVVLTIVSGVSARTAVVEGNRATRQAALATARLLANEANARIDTDLRTAQLLAVEAHRIAQTPETTSALLNAVTANPALTRFLDAGSPVLSLATSPSGRTFAAGTRDGRVVVWDGDGRKLADVTLESGPVSSLSIDGEGENVAASDGNSLALVKTRSHDPVRKLGTAGPITMIALSPDASYVATTNAKQLDTGGPAPADVTLFDAANGHELRKLALGPVPVRRIAFPDKTTLTVAEVDGASTHFDPATMRERSKTPAGGAPASRYIDGMSEDAQYYGHAKFGEAHVRGPRGGDDLSYAGMPVANAEAVAISRSGSHIAAANTGQITVSATQRFTYFGPPRHVLRGTGEVEHMAFLGDSGDLVTANEDVVVMWRPDSSGRLAQEIARTPDDYEAVTRPALTKSLDERTIGVLDETGTLSVVDTDAHEVIRQLDSRKIGTPDALTLADDRSRVLAVSMKSGHRNVELETGRSTRADANFESATRDRFIFAHPLRNMRALAVSAAGTFEVVSLVSGQTESRREHVLGDHDHSFPLPITSASVNRSETTAAILKQDEVHLVDLATGATRRLDTQQAATAEFAGDDLIVRSQDGKAEIWSADFATNRRTTMTLKPTTPIATSRSQRWLANVTEDGSIALHDYQAGTVLARLILPNPTESKSGTTGSSTSVLFAGQGEDLYSATPGGLVLRWRLSPEHWALTACATAGTALSEAQWRALISDDVPADRRCTRP
ncbi:toll/interleukin-1 receptor domain-containing protein [Lentzea alba]|uniref:TIR domain-containing protein n=1 Tax=Lentzea alba TaxID=2714351 RepID=UPI0039BF2615